MFPNLRKAASTSKSKSSFTLGIKRNSLWHVGVFDLCSLCVVLKNMVYVLLCLYTFVYVYLYVVYMFSVIMF